MKRVFEWLLALPIGAVVVALAVANRRVVTISLDPLRPADPLLSVDLPLWMPIFGALVVGILLGGAAVWWGQRRHRKAARVGRREVRRLEDERARLAAAVAAPPTVIAGPALPAPKASERAA